VRQRPTRFGRRRRRIGAPRSAARVAAFTLIELLVVVGILTVLIAIITASLVQVRVAAKSFVCKNQLKTVAFEFIQFADDYAHLWRGDSDRDDRRGFDIKDFQERLYGVAEFSKSKVDSANDAVTACYKASEHPLICPCGPQELEYYVTKRKALEEAVIPAANVSIGVNLRLYRTGQNLDEQLYLTRRILEHTRVPVAFDVDGAKADALGVLPFFSAPPVGAGDNWSFWFPPRRHGGHVNAAFVGGHVLSSSQPEKQGGWDWKYQPPPP